MELSLCSSCIISQRKTTDDVKLDMGEHTECHFIACLIYHLANEDFYGSKNIKFIVDQAFGICLDMLHS